MTLASDDPAVTSLAVIDDWDAVHDSAIGTDGAVLMAEAANFDGAALPNNVDAEGDAVRLKASQYGVQYVMLVNEDGSAQPAYDSATDSNKVSEVNPISEHHVEETLINATNIINGTYYAYLDMDGYRFLGLQIEIGAAVDSCTVTVEGTLQDDGTAPANCTYQDVTALLFGVANTSSSTMWMMDTPMSFKYIRVKYVTAGGNNDADLTVYAKRMY
jgi:hypothetical protein